MADGGAEGKGKGKETAERKLTGRVPREAIRRFDLPDLDPALIERFRKLTDLTGTVSDAMDDLGLSGAVPASTLAPSHPGHRRVGQALPERN